MIQSFSDPAGGTAITTRRRDGTTTNYLPRGSYEFPKPLHVGSIGRQGIDTPLLQSLAAAWGEADWDQVWESIIAFNAANTDAMDTPEHVEFVLLSGAFERLLDCRRGNEDELAGRFTAAFQPTDPTDPRACDRTQPHVDRFRRSKSVAEIWLRDFFRVRGHLAHGRISPGHPAIWSLPEHLLLASYCFPLIVKLVVNARGLYELTRDDREAIDWFERFASIRAFEATGDPDDQSSFPWNQVKSERTSERIRRGIEQQIRQMGWPEDVESES
ncbi:MAG: hypothetical protein M3461_20805 [Pseudomonadota bacterium]|nr:hypothetical protein [Pseudomonadota bacterium]